MNDIVPLLRRPYRAEEPDQAARAGLVLAAYPPKPPDSPPVGVTASSVQAWFDAAIDDAIPTADGTLATAQHIADVVARRAKADNTRRAYRAGVRAWCAWCDQHGLTPLPARPADIAAFLAAQRYPAPPEKPLAANTLKLRLAAIGYLHYIAGCPSPTTTARVTETLAGLDKLAKQAGQSPKPKLARQDRDPA